MRSEVAAEVENRSPEPPAALSKPGDSASRARPGLLSNAPRRAKSPRCLAERHRPQSFIDLVGNGRVNRELAEWVSNWRRRTGPCRPALIAGPPGTGKSTAIAVLSHANGFRAVTVNASAVRSGAELLKKVRDVCQSGNFLASCAACKARPGFHPDCMARDPLLVLDEVDGVNLAERDNALTHLLERLFDAQGNCLLPRPVAFVCNNMFRRGMAPLRRSCEVFCFVRDEESVARRLREVLHFEGRTASENALQALAGSFGGDIRACLNHLEVSGGDWVAVPEREECVERSLDYFELLGDLFFAQDKAVNFAAMRSRECFDGAFLNYLHAERPSCDLPLVDTLLSAFAANDVHQKSSFPRQGDFVAYSVFPLLHRSSKQHRRFKIDFLLKIFDFQNKFEENRAKMRDFLAPLDVRASKRHVYADSLVKMLFPPSAALKLNPRQQPRLKQLDELVRALGVRVTGKEPAEAFRAQPDDSRDDFAFKSQTPRREEPRLFYEPRVNELIQFSGTPVYALSEDIASFLFVGPGFAPGTPSPGLPGAAEPRGEKRLPGDAHRVNYIFHDASMSSVLYPLEAAFLFRAL